MQCSSEEAGKGELLSCLGPAAISCSAVQGGAASREGRKASTGGLSKYSALWNSKDNYSLTLVMFCLAAVSGGGVAAV